MLITRNPSHFAHAILYAPRFLKNLQSMLHGIRCQNNIARSMGRCERIDYVALNNLSSVDLELRLPPKRKYKSGAKLYEVESLISKRKSTTEVSRNFIQSGIYTP